VQMEAVWYGWRESGLGFARGGSGCGVWFEAVPWGTGLGGERENEMGQTDGRGR